jgi:hypothetical protein
LLALASRIPLGCGVAADEEGRDRRAELAAKQLDGLDTGFAVRQSIIGNDEIRLPRCAVNCASAASPDSAAITSQPQLRRIPPIPSSTSASSSMTTMRLPRTDRRPARATAGASAASLRGGLGHRDGKARPSADPRRLRPDGRASDLRRSTMAGRARARRGVRLPRPAGRTRRRCCAAGPAQCRGRCRRRRCAGSPRAPAAADHHAAASRVAHRVGHQVEQDPLEQNEIAADPGAARYHRQPQPLLARGLGKGRFYAREQRLDRKFAHIRLEQRRPRAWTCRARPRRARSSSRRRR